MIQVVVLLKVKNIEKFEGYERQAIKIMAEHSGRLISAFTSNDKESSDIEFGEIHVLEFPSVEQFHSYRADQKILELTALREQAIEKTSVYVSNVFKNYG